MLKNVRDKDLKLFNDLAKEPLPATPEQMSLRILIPAFMISELKRAFEIGFLLFLPFLIIDLVVASVLMSMGMMMLPPVVVSLPFKLIFFVLVDGWSLVAGSLVQSYGQRMRIGVRRAELEKRTRSHAPGSAPAVTRSRGAIRPGRLADRLLAASADPRPAGRARARGQHRHLRIARLHVAQEAVERIDRGDHARHLAELGAVGAKPAVTTSKARWSGPSAIFAAYFSRSRAMPSVSSASA